MLANVKEAALLVLTDQEVKPIFEEWEGLQACRVVIASETQLGALAMHEADNGGVDGYVCYREANETIDADSVVNGKLVCAGEQGLVSLLSSFDRTESSLLTYIQ